MKKYQIIIICLLFAGAGFFIGARTALNNAILTSDMDADHHKILNLPDDQPLPPPVLGSTVPPTWLGTTSTTAAAGDAAEYTANKGQNNGYASLDSGGKVPSSQIPSGVGTGTVTSVGITAANGISATPSPITGSGSFTLALGNITPAQVVLSATDGTGYLGFSAQGSVPPITSVSKLWANGGGQLAYSNSVGTNGHTVAFDGHTLTADRSYVWPDKSSTLATTLDLATTMVGVGTGHAGGLVPDTGSSGSGTDYLGRDAAWHTAATFSAPAYQPTLISTTFSPSTNTTGSRTVTIGVAGGVATVVFYSLVSSSSGFLPYPNSAITVNPGATIWSYQAKAGWTNSSIVSYTNPNP